MPPPASLAVPAIVTWLPSWTASPAVGEVIVEVGGVVSVEGVGVTSPEARDSGCAPISESRLMVNCSMVGSGGKCPGSVLPAFQALVLSSPQAHCTVPAPNTSAPLGARYSVRWWVAVLLELTVLP